MNVATRRPAIIFDDNLHKVAGELGCEIEWLRQRIAAVEKPPRKVLRRFTCTSCGHYFMTHTRQTRCPNCVTFQRFEVATIAPKFDTCRTCGDLYVPTSSTSCNRCVQFDRVLCRLDAIREQMS